LRGALAATPQRVPLDPQGALVLTTDDRPLPLDPGQIAWDLDQPRLTLASGVAASAEVLREGLHLWLAAHAPSAGLLWGARRGSHLRGLFDRGEALATLCVLDERGLALLGWSRTGSDELLVTAATAARPLAEAVVQLVRQWQAAGRPRDAQAELRAYPRGSGPPVAADEVEIERRWTRFLLRWASPRPDPSVPIG
jgi:hypothetical protein